MYNVNKKVVPVLYCISFGINVKADNVTMNRHLCCFSWSSFFIDFEETEWNVRIRDKGYKLFYNPKMISWHRPFTNFPGRGKTYVPVRVFHYCRGAILFNFKSYNSTFLVFSLYFIFIRSPIRWFTMSLKGNPYAAFIDLKGLLSAYKRIIELKNKWAKTSNP